MATITVKNIPEDLYLQLKRVAEANRRSINSEIIVCIEQAIRPQKIDTEGILAEARLLREKTSAYRISGDELTHAKNVGRP